MENLSSPGKKKMRLGVIVPQSDMEWEVREHDPYRYNVVLRHKPTGMVIEQASEKSESDGKSSCLKELRWRLRHLAEYKKSCVRECEVD